MPSKVAKQEEEQKQPLLGAKAEKADGRLDIKVTAGAVSATHISLQRHEESKGTSVRGSMVCMQAAAAAATGKGKEDV
jgi:hypothetical protein